MSPGVEVVRQPLDERLQQRDRLAEAFVDVQVDHELLLPAVVEDAVAMGDEQRFDRLAVQVEAVPQVVGDVLDAAA